MLTPRPACANRLIDEEEIAGCLPTDVGVVSDEKVVAVVVLGDAQRPAAGPQSIHRGGAGPAIQVDNEGLRAFIGFAR